MTYGTYGSRKGLWKNSNYTNVKSDFMWMLTLCKKTPDMLWEDVRSAFNFCDVIYADRLPVQKVAWTQLGIQQKSPQGGVPTICDLTKRSSFSHATVACRSHKATSNQKPAYVSVKVLNLQIKVSMFKVLLTHSWSLMSNCSWMPNVGEVRSNLMPSSCTNTSGRYGIHY